MHVKERKTIIVLGGDQERGANIAKRLGSSEVNIVIPFNANTRAVNEVISGVEARGGVAIALFADIYDGSHLEALCSTATRAFGKVDAVVCSLPTTDVMTTSAHPTAVRDIHAIMKKMHKLLRKQRSLANRVDIAAAVSPVRATA
jgi:NAD(P)-dependent dehydrogenase (short-subunit alcohol dehydrogenase family)